jgi:hypothetical protein
MDEETRLHDALVRIFSLRHRQHRPLYQAIDEVGAFSRSTFYGIDEQLREAAEREVLVQVERERQQVDDALSGLRTAEATRFDRRILEEGGDLALDTLLEIMKDSDSDFNRLKAVELWLEMARNGTVVPRAQPPVGNDTPKLPAPVQRVPTFLPPMDSLKPGSEVSVRRPDGFEVSIKTPPDPKNVVDATPASSGPPASPPSP